MSRFLSLIELDILVLLTRFGITLEKFYEGSDHVKTRLSETYQREYENFIHS
jgi:hypothetical protein